MKNSVPSSSEIVSKNWNRFSLTVNCWPLTEICRAGNRGPHVYDRAVYVALSERSIVSNSQLMPEGDGFIRSTRNCWRERSSGWCLKPLFGFEELMMSAGVKLCSKNLKCVDTVVKSFGEIRESTVKRVKNKMQPFRQQEGCVDKPHHEAILWY